MTGPLAQTVSRNVVHFVDNDLHVCGLGDFFLHFMHLLLDFFLNKHGRIYLHDLRLFFLYLHDFIRMAELALP